MDYGRPQYPLLMLALPLRGIRLICRHWITEPRTTDPATLELVLLPEPSPKGGGDLGLT